MKKLIGMVLMVLVAVGMNCMAVFATDSTAMVVPEAVGVASSLYDYFVITETAGRSGLTQTGAKGIMLEAEAMNRMNIQNILNGVTTKMSESSIDPAYDLITIAKDGTLEKGIQCKAGVSNTNVADTVNKIMNGYYPEGTEFVGTTESSKAVNAALEKAGSDVRMLDSGVSDSRVNELARKALGNPAKASEVLGRMGKSAAIFAIVDMGAAGVESYIRGDDVPETISNVSISGAEGLITGAIGSLAGDGAASILLLVGAGTAASNIVPIIVCVGTTVVIMYVLDDVVEETNLEAILADAVRKAGAEIEVAAAEIKNAAENTVSDAKRTVNTVVSDAAEGINSVKGVISTTADDVGDMVSMSIRIHRGQMGGLQVAESSHDARKDSLIIPIMN